MYALLQQSLSVKPLLTGIVFHFGGTCDLGNLAFRSVRAYIGFGNSAPSKSNTRFCSTMMKHKCNIVFAVLGKTGDKATLVFSATLCIFHNTFIGHLGFFLFVFILHKAQ